VVSGRLLAPKLSVADGAVLNGEIEMKKPSEGKLAVPDSTQKNKK
jgi:cytoskeletal protein CcmA (bactofilin family)